MKIFVVSVYALKSAGSQTAISSSGAETIDFSETSLAVKTVDAHFGYQWRLVRHYRLDWIKILLMPNELTKVFVGYDSREDIAWQVCRHSLLRHANNELAVIPLRQPVLRELGLYTRQHDAGASTEFSLTRFLAPYLAAQSGWVIFCDCDFLFTGDVRDVLEGLDPAKAVYCVQHDYSPAYQFKMDGKKQVAYPRKNWSSFMVFNCDHPDVKALTPDVVNSASPAFLHRFEWMADPSAIGALDPEWNFLEGEYPKPAKTPRVIHYTNGGPWFEEWQHCDYAELWVEERALYLEASGKARLPQAA